LTSGDKNFCDFPDNQPTKISCTLSIQENPDKNFLPSGQYGTQCGEPMTYSTC